MLARVGSAVSPDLKHKSKQSGTINAVVTDGTTTTNVATPIYVGAGAPGGGAIVNHPAENRRRENSTNKVSTVKSAEAGLFLMEDAMAQAWQQAFADETAQNDAGGGHNLAYDFGGHQGSAMSYAGGLGDTYAVAPGGSSAKNLGTKNAMTTTPFNKVAARLGAITKTKDNLGGKVILKQDMERGGYDAYTMYSQIAVGSGIQRFERDLAGNLVLGAGAFPTPAEEAALSKALNGVATPKVAEKLGKVQVRLTDIEAKLKAAQTALVNVNAARAATDDTMMGALDAVADARGIGGGGARLIPPSV